MLARLMNVGRAFFFTRGKRMAEDRVELVAQKELRYDSKQLQVGDRFTASHKDAHILKRIGKARDYVAEPPPQRAATTYQTRDMTAERTERRPPTVRRDLSGTTQAPPREVPRTPEPEKPAETHVRPALSTDSAITAPPKDA